MMKEDISCEFEEQCEKMYTDTGMDEYRKKCDGINCALCEKYWRFYDKQYFRKKNREEGKLKWKRVYSQQ